MKKIGCHDLCFISHDKNANGESLLRRILAGDKVFYTKQHCDPVDFCIEYAVG